MLRTSSATEGYRHDSIATAVKVLAEQGPPRNVSFSFTEDGRWFNTDELFKYDGLLFVSTTGEGGAYFLAHCTRTPKWDGWVDGSMDRLHCLG